MAKEEIVQRKEQTEDKIKEQTEDETSYPPKKTIIPAMLAIALAVFLVALVFCLLPIGLFILGLTQITG